MTDKIGIEIKLGNSIESEKIIRETLRRFGVANRWTIYDTDGNSKEEKTLFQSCHLHKNKDKYYLVHFKEFFILEGKDSTLTDDDIYRRNTIATILEKWGMIEIQDAENRITRLTKKIDIIAHSEKKNWNLVSKYKRGRNYE